MLAHNQAHVCSLALVVLTASLLAAPQLSAAIDQDGTAIMGFRMEGAEVPSRGPKSFMPRIFMPNICPNEL